MQEENSVQYGTGQTASNGQYRTGHPASTGHDDTGQSSPVLVSVNEAAQKLGVTIDAIRKRVQRGTILHQRDDSGRVWILLEAAKTLQDTPPSTVQDETEDVHDIDQDTYQTEDRNHLVESLEDQISYLRSVIETRDRELEARTEELSRKDHIIAALTERIPELEPPSSSESQEAPETASSGVEGVEVPIKEERRSWLYRFFFGP